MRPPHLLLLAMLLSAGTAALRRTVLQRPPRLRLLATQLAPEVRLDLPQTLRPNMLQAALPRSLPPRAAVRASTSAEPTPQPASKLTVAQLREALKALGLDTRGLKAALVERLEQARLRLPNSAMSLSNGERLQIDAVAAVPRCHAAHSAAPANARARVAGPNTDCSTRIVGVVKRVIYQSASYTVLKLGLPKGSRPSTMTLCAQNGCLCVAQVGMELSVLGRVVQHPEYGKNLAVETVEEAKPVEETMGGPQAVLLSGAIKGIGPRTAAVLVDKFGDDALRMLSEKDERLLSIPGIGPKTLGKLQAAVQKHAQSSGHTETIAFALGLDLSPNQAQTLFAKFGAETEAKVRRDPYCLCTHLPELSFNQVDNIARNKLGAAADCPSRAAAAILERLRVGLREGHCYDERVLLLGAVQRATACVELPAVKAMRLARAALDRLRKDGQVHSDFPPPAESAGATTHLPPDGRSPEDYPRDPSLAQYVYLQASVREEEAVATAVRRRLPARNTSLAIEVTSEELEAGLSNDVATISEGADVTEYVAAADCTFSPNLSAAQMLAVLRCSSMGAEAAERGKYGVLGRLMVLTGGPGTGKTFTVCQIVKRWRQQGKRVMLACPTARAASVLSESVGLPAKTIHRLLEYNPQEDAFSRDRHCPLECDAVVIDEASMLDINLAARFLEALKEECVVLFVGDANQLPSVGPGAVLHDLLLSPRVPRVELMDIFRQDPTGDIARNAALIHSGKFPMHLRRVSSVAELAKWRESRPSGTVFIPARSEHEAQKIICIGVLEWLRNVGYRVEEELQVLSPLKRGAAGTIQLNGILKQHLNPASRVATSRSEDEAQAPGRLLTNDEEEMPRLTVGDQVIQLQNDYDKQVFNGDLGVVTYVRSEGKSYFFTVDFGERRRDADGEPITVEYRKSALGRSVSLAYALTVHKAQGSEYEVVCMPMLPEQSFMLFRNLFYTGVSRAKRLLVLVGSEEAMRRAVGNVKQQTRRTLLQQRISNDAFAPPTTRHL